MFKSIKKTNSIPIFQRLFLLVFLIFPILILSQTNVSGTLVGSTIWTKVNSPYNLTGVVTLNAGDTLIIEPGVEVTFNHYSYYLVVNGTLLCNGLSNDSIYFKNTNAPGRIVLSSSGSGSEFHYTEFYGLGVFNNPALRIGSQATSVVNCHFFACERGVQVVSGAQPVIDSSLFQYSSDNGIDVLNGTPIITNNIIKNSYGFGIYLTDSAFISNNTLANNGSGNNRGGIHIDAEVYPFISGNTMTNNSWDILTQPSLLIDTLYDNNGISEIYVEGGSLAVSTVWHKPQSPEDWTYVLWSDITQNAGDTLFIEPGSKFRFGSYTVDLFINGTLLSQGNVNDSVMFFGSPYGGRIAINSSSANSILQYTMLDGLGAFNNPAIEVYSSDLLIDRCRFIRTEVGVTTRNESKPVIDSCIFELGSDYALKVISGSPTLKNSILQNIGGGGIFLSDSASIFNNTITNCGQTLGQAALVIDEIVFPYINNNVFTNSSDVATHPGVVDDTIFDNNGLSRIHIQGKTIGITTTWHQPALPEGWDYYMLGSVTVNSGDSLTIEPGLDLHIGHYTYDLLINGTFLSEGEFNDSIYISGNPIGGQIRLMSTSSNSILKFCRITGLGAFNNPGTEIHTDDVEISQCTFHVCEVGFAVYSNSSPHIDSCIISSASDHGVQVFSGSPVISYSQVMNCNLSGIQLFDSASITNCVFNGNGAISNGAGIIIEDIVYPEISANVFGSQQRDIKIHPAIAEDTLFDNNGLTKVHIDNKTIGKNTIWQKPQFPENWNYVLAGDVTVDIGDTLQIEAGVEVEFTHYTHDLIVNGTLLAEGNQNDTIKFFSASTGGRVILNSSGSHSSLDHVNFNNLGQFNIAALTIASSLSEVKNSEFVDCEIGIQSSVDLNIDSSLFESSTDYGLYVTSGIVDVHNSCFVGNNFGVKADPGSLVNAWDNWWGDTSGVTHSSNPSGIGDQVSDSVKYSPWLLKSPCEVDPGPDTVAFFPFDNSTNVSVLTHIRLNFDENVKKGNGNVTVLRTVDSSIVFNSPVSNTSIIVAGDSLFFEPGMLPIGTEVFVNIDSNAIQNINGAAFRGLLTNSEWNFTTEPDLDMDGFTLSMGDCDDMDSTEFPGQIWYADNDMDGFGNALDTIIQCEQPFGYILDSLDCDDSDSLEFPGQVWYADNDMDGFGNPNDTLISCLRPNGYLLDSTDCDDSDSLKFPGQIWYADLDNDGFGDAGNTLVQCVQPFGYVRDSSDCDDSDSLEFPNQIWYADADHDGFGDSLNSLVQCERPADYVLDRTDCDDTDSLSYPGAAEIFDNKDNDCDGEVDEDWIGVQKLNGNSQFRIYPNPSKGKLTLENHTGLDGHIMVNGLNGNVVFQTSFSSVDIQSFSLPDHLRDGTYILNIVNDLNTYFQVIILQRE